MGCRKNLVSLQGLEIKACFFQRDRELSDGSTTSDSSSFLTEVLIPIVDQALFGARATFR